MGNIVVKLVGYMYYIAVFVAVITLPFLIIKALVLYGHSDAESKVRGKHLITVSIQFAIVLAVLPPLIGLILRFLQPLINVPQAQSPSTAVHSVNPVASGAGWVFSILLSLLSYLIVAIEGFVKVIAAFFTLPLIYMSEKMDQGGTSATIVTSHMLDRVWLFFFALAVGIIAVGFLYNYVSDILKENVGEETSREGVNIMNYINRIVVALVASVISYPIGKIVLWLNSVLEQYIASSIQFPNMGNWFTNTPFSGINLAQTPLTNSIAFITLAPHTREFLNSIFKVTGGIFSVFDLKEVMALGFFQSYSIFFLLAIALYFAMRLIMVVFWFGFAPVIFAVAIGYKGKFNAISAWVGNFFTWALFPSVVAIGIFVISQIVSVMSKTALPQAGMGYTSTFALLLYGAGMVFIMRLPNMLKNVFTRMGESLEAGAFLQGIIQRMKVI